MTKESLHGNKSSPVGLDGGGDRQFVREVSYREQGKKRESTSGWRSFLPMPTVFDYLINVWGISMGVALAG